MKKFFGYLVALVLVVGVSAATTYLVLLKAQPEVVMTKVVNGDTISAMPVPVQYQRMAMLPKQETDFTAAAELSVNAVVHVKTTYQQSRQYMSDPFFEFFFGRPQQQRELPQQQASGSGVIISQDGYIVTNNHVIDKAQQIEVVLNDKRQFTATLVGTDPNTDIALLKIDANNLPVILMGNSDNLKVGEWVLAVGNPFNLTSTVTAGIVSAKARNINILDSDMKIESFIQTDAAVNPGNSGGALVNTAGELVGINTAIASQTGSYSGYSFAVPVSIVQKVVSDLKQYGIVQRAILGVQMQEITPELQREKHLTTLQGAYVVSVVKDGAAYKAGIKAGDVITQIDATPIKSGTDLQEQIGRHKPGDSVTLTILRQGNLLTFTAELTNKNGGTGLVEKQDEKVQLGAQFAEISDSLKEKLGISYGLQVKNLQSGRLRNAGVPKDFIILKANQRAIRTEEDLNEVVAEAMKAQERERVVWLTGCMPNGRVQYHAINLDN
ncbi:MAG: Do family serine endopeptidase [Paludibacteraceae bacterium]|nr:Do family serine endopeptidase [Paludibacteraceae bacterium]